MYITHSICGYDVTNFGDRYSFIHKTKRCKFCVGYQIPSRHCPTLAFPFNKQLQWIGKKVDKRVITKEMYYKLGPFLVKTTTPNGVYHNVAHIRT